MPCLCMTSSEAGGEVQDVSSEGVESVHNDSQERVGDHDDDGVAAKRLADDVDGLDSIHGGSRKAAKLQQKQPDAFVKCELCPRPARVVCKDTTTGNIWLCAVIPPLFWNLVRTLQTQAFSDSKYSGLALDFAVPNGEVETG